MCPFERRGSHVSLHFWNLFSRQGMINSHQHQYEAYGANSHRVALNGYLDIELV